MNSAVCQAGLLRLRVNLQPLAPVEPSLKAAVGCFFESCSVPAADSAPRLLKARTGPELDPALRGSGGLLPAVWPPGSPPLAVKVPFPALGRGCGRLTGSWFGSACS